MSDPKNVGEVVDWLTSRPEEPFWFAERGDRLLIGVRTEAGEVMVWNCQIKNRRFALSAPSASLRDPRAEARADGWDEAADFLAAMWDDGDQTPAGFDPKKTAEVLLLRDHARRIRALSTPSPAPDAEKETP